MAMSQPSRPSLFTFNSDRPRTSDSVKPQRLKRPTTSRNVSFNTTPIYDNDSYPISEPLAWKKQEQWQKVNRHAQNVDIHIAPTPPSTARPSVTPFVAYDDSFATLLGSSPSIKLLINDIRAPYFYSGGAWIPRLSTLFLTSNLLRDVEPSGVSAAGKRTEISKIDIYSSEDFTRDKVRCQDRSYLAAGCAPHPSPESPGIVLCAQGTLKEPAGLVYVDGKRPHKSHMLLNNFQGRPFNSPCDIATNYVDNCLYFTDPAYGHERGYRPKPELPTRHIYRFDPSSGDCRVVAEGVSRPGGLAFSPDFRVLYISDLSDRYGGTTIHAFDVMYTLPAYHPAPLALSISTTSAPRTDTPSGHQKNISSSSTNSSSSSTHYTTKDPPIASPQALAAAANLASRASPTSLGNGASNLSRSNSRDRARRVLDIAQSSSRQLRSMSSNIGLNLKSSFNTTPTLPHTILQYQQHQHQPVQPPHPSTPPPESSGSLSQSIAQGGRLGAFLTNKRLFAYSAANSSSGGISTDAVQGNLWLGTGDGVEIYSGSMGSLVGKVLVPEDDDSPTTERRTDGKKMKGVSRVAFTNQGEAWLLGGERLWRIGFGDVGGTGYGVA